MLLPHRPEILLTEQQKRILWQLRVSGPSPRIQPAGTLGMNGASMTRVTQQMMALGIVEERETGGGADARAADGTACRFWPRRMGGRRDCTSRLAGTGAGRFLGAAVDP